MSATPPTDPKDAVKQQLTSAIIWTVLAVVFAVGLLFYSTTVDPEKKTLYLIAAAIGGIVAVFNGYNAWTLYQKSKK